ncbi:protein obstructor-E-like isoform X2 [Penaeus japonicus]|uniref:protein obstructor-E-like isoform X2 n=1 Tax=Penaeus japonicus TaxID=27405 RepID=UPI001C71256D|nr:protein obstructor-E-like isoform X2 [Penaeus japonicus]
MLSVTVLIAGLALAAGIPQRNQLESFSGSQFLCPEPYGFFADLEQCDKYYECIDDIPKPLLCEDGKVYDEFKGKAGHVDPCDIPYVVDCGDRLLMQPPSNSSVYCPRLHGIFADNKFCNKYYTCIDGLHTVTECPAGLHFDRKTGTCAWEAAAGRTNCADEKKCINDFCCEGAQDFVDGEGRSVPHPAFPNLVDCQKFYVCHNGINPQEASCSLGQVFNEETMMCDYPENVFACIGWYRDHPAFADYYDENGTPINPSIGNEDVVA